jgi:hypothetical protein
MCITSSSPLYHLTVVVNVFAEIVYYDIDGVSGHVEVVRQYLGRPLHTHN